MSTKVKRMPSHYPPLPFHGIRAISFISASIVVGILVYFIIQLKVDSFKIPWTFLVVSSVVARHLQTLTGLGLARVRIEPHCSRSDCPYSLLRSVITALECPPQHSHSDPLGRRHWLTGR